jgi:hypothetical protein
LVMRFRTTCISDSYRSTLLKSPGSNVVLFMIHRLASAMMRHPSHPRVWRVECGGSPPLS